MINKMKFPAIYLISFVLLTSCQNKKTSESLNKNTSDQSESNVVRLTNEQIKAIGIKPGSISYRNLRTSLKVNGKLELPPQNKAQVSILIGGIVKDIPVTEGQFVNKGQILAILENTEFLQFQQDYLESLSSLELLKAELDRQKELRNDNINATKILQQAQNNYNIAISKKNLYTEKLKLFGLNPETLTPDKIKSTFNMTAPITGYIKQINLFIGKFAEPNLPQFEIVDNRFLHIDLTIYEQDVAKIHEGQNLTFSIINDPHHTHTASIFSINKAFEDNTQAVIAHAKIHKVEDNLFPGMFIEARIQIDDYKAMALPEEAIVSSGEEHFIYLMQDDNSFRQVQVHLGTSDMGFTEIIPTEALSDSSKIVINGAYYLMSHLTKGEGKHNE